MGRALLIAEYFIQTKSKDSPKLYPIYIATSHFESMEAEKFVMNRKFQMKDTFAHIFKNEPNVVVLGDFNFDNQEEYEQNIEKFNFTEIIKERF